MWDKTFHHLFPCSIIDEPYHTILVPCFKARLQPFTVLFSFSAILVCFINAQIHSYFHEKMSGFERQY